MKKVMTFMLIICLLLASCKFLTKGETNGDRLGISARASVEETQFIADSVAPMQTIETEKYTLFWENGKSYMQLVSVPDDESSNGSFSQVINYPEFSSVREMKQKLSMGDLTEEEIEALMVYAPDNANTIEVCDINSLYEAIYPNDITMKYIIYYGQTYSFALDGGYISCLTQEAYHSKFDRDYNGTNLSDNIVITSERTVDDRNAEELVYNYYGTEIRRVRYSNETSHGTQYILEIYREGVINGVYIFGTSNGAYYGVYMHDLEERPSIEWLSSFGLREYVETEVF